MHVANHASFWGAFIAVVATMAHSEDLQAIHADGICSLPAWALAATQSVGRACGLFNADGLPAPPM